MKHRAGRLAFGVICIGVELAAQAQSPQSYQVDQAFSGSFNDTVKAFTIQPGTQTWYAGGRFTQFNGRPVSSLVKWNSLGLDTSFKAPTYPYIALDCKANGSLYSRSVRRSQIDWPVKWLRHKANGSRDSIYGSYEEVILEDGSGASILYNGSGSWGMGQGYFATVLNPQGVYVDTVWVGGKFDSRPVLTALRSGNLVSMGVSVTSRDFRTYLFSPTLVQIVPRAWIGTNPLGVGGLSMVSPSGHIYSEILMTGPGVEGYHNFRRYNPDLKQDTTYSSLEEGEFLNVLPDLSVIVKRNDSLYRVLANGQPDLHFGPFPAAGVTGMQGTDDMQYIYLHGSFQNFAGTSNNRIARLVLYSPVANASKPTVRRFGLAPSPANAMVTVSGASGEAIQVLTARGQQVLAMPSQASSTTLDIRNLPAGLYLVRCGRQTARLVVE